MSEPAFRVFDDPLGDPFVRYVEQNGTWYRLDEAALIEMQERSLRQWSLTLTTRVDHRTYETFWGGAPMPRETQAERISRLLRDFGFPPSER